MGESKLFLTVALLLLVLGCGGGGGSGSETGGGGSSKVESGPSICTATSTDRSTSTSVSPCDVMKGCCKDVASNMQEAKAACELSAMGKQTDQECLAYLPVLKSLGACSMGSTAGVSKCIYTATDCSTGLPATGAECFPVSEGELCPLPTQDLITDFTYTSSADDTYGFSTTLSADVFVVGDGIKLDATNNNLHLTGTVDTLAGFSLGLRACDRLDASKYKGISFKISGSAGPSNVVTLQVETLNDKIASSWLKAHGDYAPDGAPGACIPTSGSNMYDQSSCVAPTKSIAIPASPTVQRVLWSDFQSGKPEKSVTSTDILHFMWYFAIPEGAGTDSVKSYVVDILVDDLMFIP